MTKKLDATRDKLLDATLAHVPFDGWTDDRARGRRQGHRHRPADRATAPSRAARSP